MPVSFHLSRAAWAIHTNSAWDSLAPLSMPNRCLSAASVGGAETDNAEPAWDPAWLAPSSVDLRLALADKGRTLAGEVEQSVNPEVAEISNVPLPAGFRQLMKFSTLGVPAGEPGPVQLPLELPRPLSPNMSVLVDVPCFRNPIPFVPPLPALVLARMSRQTVVFSPAVLLPESMRMPGRTPASGAATLLLITVAFSVPLELLAVSRIPLPLVFWVTLPSSFMVRLGLSVTAKC